LGNSEYQELKIQLQAYSAALNSASDENIGRGAVDVIKDQVRQYIDKASKSGIPLIQIESGLKCLCDQVVIPTILWPWVQQELAEAKERASNEASAMPLLPIIKKPPTPESPLFCKDTLYHASLCCVAISDRNNANVHTYFQNKNPNHSFTEISFSQHSERITPYLIAVQEDILYVAFRGTQSIDEWVDCTSFDEGLRQQCNEIPLRFFIDQLNLNKKIIFTGFSFGGMLACCVCVRLWKSTTKQEVLLQRATCITFGQPLLKIKMVEEEIRVSPQFEKSIHSVYSMDDNVPLMISCMDVVARHPPKFAIIPPSEEKRRLAEFRSQPDDRFGNQFVKVKKYLKNLAVLQKYLPQVSSRAHSAAAKKSQQDSKRRVHNAVEDLKKTLQEIAVYIEQIEGILYGNCYIISTKDKEEGVKWQQQPKHLAAIELSQRTKLVTVDEELFKLHAMAEYMLILYRSHLQYEYSVPNATKGINDIAVLKPRVTGLDIHQYHNEHVLVLKGEYLWFAYEISVDDNGVIETPAESTTKSMIEFRISHDHKAYSTLCAGKQVKIVLFTHFAKPIRQSIDTKKESHLFSVRQIQLAMHTPTQVIQLAYLCALLEQRTQPFDSTSKRYKAVACFLEEVVKVVPLESVFDAIAYEDHHIALECATALKQRNPNLQFSQQMITGAGIAATRAISGYRGDVIDQFFLPLMFTHNLLSCYFSEFQPQQLPDDSSEWDGQHHESNPNNKDGQKQSTRVPSQLSKKKANKPSYSAVASKGSSESKSIVSKEVVSPQLVQPQAIKMLLRPPPFIPVPIPVVVDRFQQPMPFPPDLVKYLNGCVTALLKQRPSVHAVSAVGSTNIEEVYPIAGTRRKQYFKSPLQVLREAMQDIEKYTEETQRKNPSRTETSNRRMLNLIYKIYNEDVAVCASLLGAFMEQQIRIPLINDSLKETAEVLSDAAPVAVGVWALFSQNLRSLQEMLSASNHSALVIEIKEYIESVSEQISDYENKMYAGKLQFLLQGIKETVTASSQYISYSLEHHLFKNIKFDKNLSLKQLITQWDKLFENDALSLIGRSHRSLVARWLKWTLLVHNLREALAEYTCIGVTGLVNSGKSLLVKELFKIEKVKVGTRAVKRTTVPLLYNLEGKIEGLDVIDFPGVDDSDNSVPDMARLLLSLAQIVVFVVDYRKACSDPVKHWLQLLTKNGVPILVCLTYADVLYEECRDDQSESSIDSELMHIQKQLKLDDPPTAEVAFYSFKHPSGVTSTDLSKYGILSLADVGHWLVETLQSKFKQEELAKNLRMFLTTDSN
jgi:GTP-binding protein EngB required for normal cell division